MDDANDVVTSNLQLKLRPFSTEREQQEHQRLHSAAGARWR